MPLDGAETAALIVLRDLRTGGSRSQRGWVVETIQVFFLTYLFCLIYLFILQTGQFALESSLPHRVAIYEYNHFNKPIELFLRSLDCQTRQQPPLCSKALFTPSSPTANHLNCLQTTCSFIEAGRGKKKEKKRKTFLFRFFAKMSKCDK